MKVRIKFAKQGAMKFIGHLDIMRYFQKALRRCGLDVAFTEGFSPHMVMSFAQPLGVGLTSVGEYMDIELKTPVSSEEGVRRLNAVMAEGMEVLSMRQIQEGKMGKAMSLVAAADYIVEFRDSQPLPDDWKEKLDGFLTQEKILVIKQSKKKDTEVDIRPHLYRMEVQGDGIFLQLAAGSAVNIRPELVLDAFAAYAGIELQPFSLLVERKELYADKGTEGNRRLISLEELGEPIVC